MHALSVTPSRSPRYPLMSSYTPTFPHMYYPHTLYQPTPQATLKLGLVRLHPAFMLTGLSFYEPTEAVPLHIHDR